MLRGAKVPGFQGSRVPPPSEATLARLWAGQRFPAAALVTRQGAPVRVLHPGRPGRGPGPDFRDALLALGPGGVVRGDVELHVRASSFVQHGHHRDRRYQRVALHVVFEDDAGGETRLANGTWAPVVVLRDWLRRRSDELAGWLAGPELWREPCACAAARLGGDELLRLLAGLGDERFARRAEALSAALKQRGEEGALYGALLEGLGYGGDRALLASLAAALPWAELRGALTRAPPAERPGVAEALLLGAAGLLPSQRGESAHHPHEAALEARWREWGRGRGQPPATGIVSRPANHPARRLAGLAALLARHGPALESIELRTEPAKSLVAAWSAPATGYWRGYLAPGLLAKRPPGALIGRARAVELLANAVLPWWAARAALRGDRAGDGLARELFAALPRPARYGALEFLERNLAGDGAALPLDARRQQGLLELYKTECTQSGCGRCVLS